MPSILDVLAALLRSHGRSVGRHAKGLVFWSALVGILFFVAGIYFVILLTHLLAVWLGPAVALAGIASGALLLALVAVLMVRSEKRRLLAAHREHVEQERLALRAALAEVIVAGKLSGSVGALSATVAAVIVVLLRRLGDDSQEEPPREDQTPPPGPEGGGAA